MKEMIDNRKVHSTRMKGIERVLQRKEDESCDYQPGKMNAKPDQKADFRRKGGSLTPRKA